MKVKTKNLLYYAAFMLTAILRLCTSSTLFVVTHEANQFITLIILLMFSIKILLDKHTYKELFLISIAAAISMYLFIVLDIAFIVITFFAFISIKDVEIKKVIKIDIVIKCIFLLSHSILYGLDYFFEYEKIESLILMSKKGISHAFYFSNPNTVGMLVFWLIMDLEFLSSKNSHKKFVIESLLILSVYSLTKCRTSLVLYIVYLVIKQIKNKKIIDNMNKYMYIILSLLAFAIIYFLKEDNVTFQFFNGLLSGRLSYSIRAYNILKIHFLPYYVSDLFFETYIIDNHYVKSLIHYGIITLLIFYIPYLLIPKEKFMKQKKISIISALFLFFERATINIGYATPYLIMADVIFNKKEALYEEKSRNNNDVPQ